LLRSPAAGLLTNRLNPRCNEPFESTMYYCPRSISTTARRGLCLAMTRVLVGDAFLADVTDDVLAAVNADDVPAHPSGIFFRKEDDHSRDVLGRRETAAGILRLGDPEHVDTSRDLAERGSVRDPRHDRVGRDAEGAELVRELADMGFECRLGRRYRAIIGERAVPPELVIANILPPRLIRFRQNNP